MIVVPVKDMSPIPQVSLSLAQACGYFKVIPRDILLIILAKIMVGPPNMSWEAFRAFTFSCKQLAGPPNDRLYSDPQIVESTNDFILRLYQFYHQTTHRPKTYSNRPITLGFEKTCLAIERLVRNNPKGLSRLSFRGMSSNVFKPALRKILAKAVKFPAAHRLSMIDLSKSSFNMSHFLNLRVTWEKLASENPVEVKFKHFHMLITPENSNDLKKLHDLETTYQGRVTSYQSLRGSMGSLFLNAFVIDEADVQALQSCPYATHLMSVTLVGSQRLMAIKDWHGLTNLVKLKIAVSSDEQNPAFPLFFNSVVLTNLQAATLKWDSGQKPDFEEINASLDALRTCAPNLTKLGLLNIAKLAASQFDLIAGFPRLIHLSVPSPELKDTAFAVNVLAAVGLHSRLRSLQLYPQAIYQPNSWDPSITFQQLECLDIIGSEEKNIDNIRGLIRCAPQLYRFESAIAIDDGARLAYLKQIVSKPKTKNRRQAEAFGTHPRKRYAQNMSGIPKPKNMDEAF